MVAETEEIQNALKSAIQEINNASQATSTAVQNWINNIPWNPFGIIARTLQSANGQ